MGYVIAGLGGFSLVFGAAVVVAMAAPFTGVLIVAAGLGLLGLGACDVLLVEEVEG